MSENALKIENEKLKEVSDIARNQIELLETRKQSENTELESLRKQVLEMQATSDERALAGRLHRQIVSMQGRCRFNHPETIVNMVIIRLIEWLIIQHIRYWTGQGI